MILDCCKPTLSRRGLLFLAGAMWLAVGLMLGSFAYTWLRPLPGLLALALTGAGVAIAVAAYRLGFVSLARRNIERIHGLSERPCVFAFLQWKSYVMIAVMASGGALLRHSAVPKPFLAVVYLGMGGSLLLSSLQYFPYAWPLS